LANDRGALAIMCGRNEEPRPSAMTHWRIIMACAHYKAMDTHYQYWEISIDKIKKDR
jgi:hypothetical protein